MDMESTPVDTVKKRRRVASKKKDAKLPKVASAPATKKQVQVPASYGCPGIEVTSSVISSVDELRREFFIPPSIDVQVPDRAEIPTRPRPGYIAVHLESLRSGLRLPFQPVVQELLARLGICAAQMVPTCYRFLCVCHSLWYEASKEAMTADDFWNLYRVIQVNKNQGLYYVLNRKNARLFFDMPGKNHKWKLPWVWVSESAAGRAPLTFGSLVPLEVDGEGQELKFVRTLQGLMGTVSYSDFYSVADWVESGWFVPDFTFLNSNPEKTISRVPSPVVDDGMSHQKRRTNHSRSKKNNSTSDPKGASTRSLGGDQSPDVHPRPQSPPIQEPRDSRKCHAASGGPDSSLNHAHLHPGFVSKSEEAALALSRKAVHTIERVSMDYLVEEVTRDNASLHSHHTEMLAKALISSLNLNFCARLDAIELTRLKAELTLAQDARVSTSESTDLRALRSDLATVTEERDFFKAELSLVTKTLEGEEARVRDQCMGIANARLTDLQAKHEACETKLSNLRTLFEEVNRSLVESEVRATVHQASAEVAVKAAGRLEVELVAARGIVAHLETELAGERRKRKSRRCMQLSHRP